MTCPACGHEHQGKALAYICVGCPCPEKPAAAEENVHAECDREWSTLNALLAEREHAEDDELDSVLTWLRRHARDQLLGIQAPPLADLIQALERLEHRR